MPFSASIARRLGIERYASQMPSYPARKMDGPPCRVYPVAFISSRPISMRRISRGAGADLHQLGVAHDPRDRAVVEEARAAHRLHRLHRLLHRLLGGIEHAGRRVLARDLRRGRRPAATA